MGLARMRGKSVVVSGAALGIGRATARKFAEEGASLVIQDIQEAPLRAFRDELRQGGAPVEAVVGDVAQDKDCQAMIRAAVEAFGRVDVVVANAGIIELGDALESTAASWDKIMAIDGRGMFLTCKYAMPPCLRQVAARLFASLPFPGWLGRNDKRLMARPSLWPPAWSSIWQSSGPTGGSESMGSLPGRSRLSASSVSPTNRVVPSTWRLFGKAIPWAGLANLRKWPTRFFFWPRRKHRSLRGPFSRSMAAIWLNKHTSLARSCPIICEKA